MELTIDGRGGASASGHHRLRRGAAERNHNSDALPFAEPDARWGLPLVRGGHGSAGVERDLRAAGGAGNEGGHEFRESSGGAENAAGIADGRSSVTVHAPTHSGDCELETLAKAAGVATPRFARRTISRGTDDSSLAIAVDHDACILCDRCIRGCDEIKNNFVLGRMGKGYSAGIAFDLNHRWETRPAFRAGNAWSLAPPGH